MSGEVRDPEARADMLAKRVASEALQRQRADRAVTLPEELLVAPTEGLPGETIIRYEAWKMPRGCVVQEIPSRKVEAIYDRFEEAAAHADQLNKWVASRPSPDRRYRLFLPPVERTEAELIGMIDKLYDVETRPLSFLSVTIESGGVE